MPRPASAARLRGRMRMSSLLGTSGPPVSMPATTAKPAAAVPRIRVLIPTILRSYTGGVDAVELSPAGNERAVTLADARAALDARYPGIRFRVIDEQGHIRPHIKMFIDG